MADQGMGCLLCKQVLTDGEQVVRVEIVHHSSDGALATREEPGGRYVHLHHLERAAIMAGPGHRKGHW